jgi:hypothetical protein
MIQKANMQDIIACEAERKRGLFENLGVRTRWEWEFFRRLKSGKLRKFGEDFTPNVCTTEGINFMLDVMFHGTAAVATWYIALFENDYTPLITNTYAVPGYTECEAYDEATRVAYNEAGASSKVTTNSANKAVFTFNGTKTIYGGSLVSNSTKGDAAAEGAVLFCSSKLSSSQSVIATDVLRVTIAITGADT